MNLIYEVIGYPQGRLTPTNFFVTKGKNAFGKSTRQFNSVFKKGREKYVLMFSATGFEKTKLAESIASAQRFLGYIIEQDGRLFSGLEEHSIKGRYGCSTMIKILPDTVCLAKGVEFQIFSNHQWYFDFDIQHMLQERAFSVLEFIKLSKV